MTNRREVLTAEAASNRLRADPYAFIKADITVDGNGIEKITGRLIGFVPVGQDLQTLSNSMFMILMLENRGAPFQVGLLAHELLMIDHKDFDLQ